MGIFGRLFGKAPAKSAAADDDLLDGVDDEDAGTVAVTDLSVESSPKQVCRYIFQQMMAGRSPAQLQTELQQRGFKAKTADTYIQLIRVTMFRGR
tara:strand:- start:521 stop:805 length:285 start_codon:yes stop_codon:yes gene_type:complete